jgi:hypothetical protein
MPLFKVTLKKYLNRIQNIFKSFITYCYYYNFKKTDKKIKKMIDNI